MKTNSDKKITFLLHTNGRYPGGGLKVILEYANMLSQRGYSVQIVYPAFINWRKVGIISKLKMVYHALKAWVFGWRCNRWFNLDDKVREVFTLNLEFKRVPTSDIFIATEARTSSYVATYPTEKKYYFIQGYENWWLNERELHATYQLPLKKIVVSNWLKNKLLKLGYKSAIVPNSFDFDYFKYYKPIEQRSALTVAIMYSKHLLKDVALSLCALRNVKKKHNKLRVLAFGITPRPSELDSWIEYTQCPTREQHNYIYNEASIFVASSKSEGWGLTVGESMICGAAVACTDIDGYREMVTNNETALLSKVGDVDGLTYNINTLIEDDELRIRIATRGRYQIHKFSRDNSFQKLKEALNIKDIQ